MVAVDGDGGEDKAAIAAPAKSRLIDVLGPGLITGASDDDPSGIATYSQTGAAFGYAASWTLVFSYPLMSAVQIISARLGRTTGKGLAGNLRAHYPNWLVYAGVGLLLFANIVNIGADIGAMADAVKMLVGGPSLLYVVAFGVACVITQVFMAYDRYVGVLKWLTLALFAYVATAVLVQVDLKALAMNLLVPQLSFDRSYLTAIVAIFGTTISPYLFFWQAAQEVEDIKDKPEREPLTKAPEQAPDAQKRIELDTLVGMGISNVIALAIMVTAAATLHAHGKTDIQSSAQAAEALQPIAGSLAQALFALGIVGTGLLAVPVLAGSAAYGVGEALKWPTGLGRKPQRAKAFYATIALATLAGVGLNFSPVNPIEALYWSAVLNGVVAVPILAIMMLMATNRAVMKEFTIGPSLRILGWLTTGVMGLVAAAMIGFSL